jgi:hypothetical protein
MKLHIMKFSPTSCHFVSFPSVFGKILASFFSVDSIVSNNLVPFQVLFTVSEELAASFYGMIHLSQTKMLSCFCSDFCVSDELPTSISGPIRLFGMS